MTFKSIFTAIYGNGGLTRMEKIEFGVTCAIAVALVLVALVLSIAVLIG